MQKTAICSRGPGANQTAIIPIPLPTGLQGIPIPLGAVAALDGGPSWYFRALPFRAMAKLKKAMAQRTACEPLTVIAMARREQIWHLSG